MNARPIALLVAAAPMAMANPSAVTWTNFLRQQQVGTGVEMQVAIDPTGTRPSLLPLEAQGARFTIWTTRNGSSQAPTLLDTKFVDAYQISSQIEIQTGDPYTLIPRTRVDQPFTVRVNVGGLLAGSQIEEGARRVAFRHTASLYPANVHVPPAGLASTPVYQGFLEQNGWHVFQFSGTNIPATNLATSSGEENFAVSSLAGLGAAGNTLANARLQVWPMADVTITGIESGQTYSTLPEVTFEFQDLYPDSTTWVQVYQGSPSLGNSGVTISSSIIPIRDVTPQDRQLILRDWNDHVTGEGPWTLEVLHTTPFGTERLRHVTFNMDMTIEVTGQLFSSE